MEIQIIEKFLECDEETTQTILKKIISLQHDKMNEDIMKVVKALRRGGDSSRLSMDMAIKSVVSIYNAEMGYINIIWDDGECWWDEKANTRFDSDYKNLYANCLKEKQHQSTEDWWRKQHFIKFEDIVMEY